MRTDVSHAIESRVVELWVVAAAVGMTLCSGGCATGQHGPHEIRSAEQPLLSVSDCEAMDGEVIGDIGDGRIHRPDFVCASGRRPLGRIEPGDPGPIPTDGSVCCPK